MCSKNWNIIDYSIEERGDGYIQVSLDINENEIFINGKMVDDLNVLDKNDIYTLIYRTIHETD